MSEEKEWGFAPFIDYWDAVSELLESRYAITLEDAHNDPDHVAEAQEAGDTPEEYVAGLALRHGLRSINAEA